MWPRPHSKIVAEGAPGCRKPVERPTARSAEGKEREMDKWMVIGGIWLLVMVLLTLFVRGASPARNRALSMARSRQQRLKALQGQEAQQAGAVGEH